MSPEEKKRFRPERNVHTCISPQSWDLEPAGDKDSPRLEELGLSKEDLERRAWENTNSWLTKQFNQEIGAFHGFYDPRSKALADPQTVNLIAPFQLMAAFDRFEDGKWLDMARRCGHWLDNHMVETHPMSVTLGGVRDNIKETQLWTKYTADYATLNLGLWDRLDEDIFLERALQSCTFLLQAQHHGYSPKYNDWHELWGNKGWQSFGRVVSAMLAAYEFTDDEGWLERAKAWAEFGLSLQAKNGCFYLINDTYYSSDIAADEIRALIRMYWRTQEKTYLDAGLGFADWHVEHQTESGAWSLSEDRWGVPVAQYVGPGDAPNIAVSLLLAHWATNQPKYAVAAVKAIRYSLSQQQLPGVEGEPFVEDPMTHWGYWSWDPHYDYTMSADQSTHHVRGYWFFLDYFLSLTEDQQRDICSAVSDSDTAD